jgi:hypothetical protein
VYGVKDGLLVVFNIKGNEKKILSLDLWATNNFFHRRATLTLQP